MLSGRQNQWPSSLVLKQNLKCAWRQRIKSKWKYRISVCVFNWWKLVQGSAHTTASASWISMHFLSLLHTWPCFSNLRARTRSPWTPRGKLWVFMCRTQNCTSPLRSVHSVEELSLRVGSKPSLSKDVTLFCLIQRREDKSCQWFYLNKLFKI